MKLRFEVVGVERVPVQTVPGVFEGQGARWVTNWRLSSRGTRWNLGLVFGV